MILDTTFVIDLMKGEREAIKKAEELKIKNEPLALTSVTLFELMSGVARSEYPLKEREKIDSVSEGLVVYTLDKVSAERGGLIDGTLIAQGERIDPEDSMIAGIALTQGETLLTRNTKHFSKVTGLKIETY